MDSKLIMKRSEVMMLKTRVSKRVLCIAMVLMVLMTFSMSAFADNIVRSTTISYSFFGPAGMDLSSLIPSTAYYSSGGVTGYLPYSSYTVTSQVPDLVDNNYYTYNVNVVYSGYLIIPASIWVTQTYNIGVYATPDTLESSISAVMGGYYSIYYSDANYAGSINLSSSTVTNQMPDLVDYGYYYYNITLVYSGYVNAR